MMTDPVADMLTRIRNALKVERMLIDIPYSRLKLGMIEVMKREGYIRSYVIVEDKPFNKIRVQLGYGPAECAIQRIRRVSKPGRRCYCGPNDLRPVLNGLGIRILSTNKGIISDREAKEQNVGGEVLCEIW